MFPNIFIDKGVNMEILNKIINFGNGAYFDITLFLFVQLINVISSVVKSIVLINGTKRQASVVSTISYTIGGFATKMISQQSFIVITIVMVVTNLLGTYIGKTIVEKTEKDKYWIYNATLVDCRNLGLISTLEDKLKFRGIEYTALNAKNNRSVIMIFSNSKAESAMIEDILSSKVFNNGKISYHITQGV